MLKLLLKKQLMEVFRSYFYDAKKNKARSKGTTIAYIVMFVLLMVGVLGGMFAVLAAWVLLGESISAMQAAGGAVVLLGLALARQGDRGELPDPDALTPLASTRADRS